MTLSTASRWEGASRLPRAADVRWRTRSRSEEAEVDELAPERLRHRREVAGGAAEVARGVLGVEVAPALERPARPRLDRDHHRLDDQAAAPDAVAVGERPDRGEPLPAGDLALDHPVERAAVDDRVEALRHHAGGMGLLVGPAEAPVMGAVLLDPILEVADRIAADAELQQMEHAAALARRRVPGREDNEPRPFGDLLAGLGRDLGDLAGGGCDERVLHLHRLDDGEALALLDPVAGADEDGDELAVHRRLDGAALVDVLEVDRERIVAVDPRLAAVPQHDQSAVGAREGAVVVDEMRRAEARDAASECDLGALGRPGDVHVVAMALDHDREAVAARRAELKAVALGPRRVKPLGRREARPARLEGFPFVVDQHQRAEARRLLVEGLLDRAERLEV